MLLCLCKAAFVFKTFIRRRRRILFLIYQFQFLSVCHSSREAEDILKNSGRCHSSRPRDPPLLFRLPANHPWWTAATTQDASGIIIQSGFSKHFLSTIHLVILPYHGKKLFLFLKHQSSLNKRTVLSQESNNNFLYIWQTGFCIFSLILFYDPKSTLFPRTWAFCSFVCPLRIGQRSSQWSFILF